MYFFILQGEGGTGKTFLINLLSQWSEMKLRKPGDKTKYPKTIRLAATGNAAYLIGK
jgi:predicted ATPase